MHVHSDRRKEKGVKTAGQDIFFFFFSYFEYVSFFMKYSSDLSC